MVEKHIELVGILNVTPDSFSDGGLFIDPQKAIARTKELFDEGASYVDAGAESTRPGAIPLTHEQEMGRLYTVLSSIIPGYPGHISLDTHHPETVRQVAAEIGSFIINDVTGFNNPDMVQAAADLQLQIIVSHLPKTFGKDIQAAHNSTDLIDRVDQVLHELMTTRGRLISAGIHRDLIILDPGIGFGKTTRANWELVSFAKHVPGIPVMIGYSRKGFLHKDPAAGDAIPELIQLKERAIATDATDQDKAAYAAWRDPLHGSLAREARDSGAKYLRVHDVKSHKQALETT